MESGWYPPEADTTEKRLRYYGTKFPLVEVALHLLHPAQRAQQRALGIAQPVGFTFNVKAFSLLTQHPTRPSALYKVLRPETEKKNVYLKDFDAEVINVIWTQFLAALGPLLDADKLGALLFQFPPWFGINKSNKQYILHAKERCVPFPMCVEFRNASWLSDENRAETLEFLTSYTVPLVCVDMPQGHRSSVPPVLAATADLAVVRFHGHSDKWTSRNIYERFGYLYSEDELSDWAPRLRDLANQAQTMHVVMNNCYRDYAQTNAEQLARLLGAAGERRRTSSS
nr:DUF72 domain-containing protein [Actinopolymorpha pittospori]